MDFGTDMDLGMEGFDPQFTLVTGARLVLNAALRRWTTAEESAAGQRIYKGRCRDIRQLLTARYDQARLVALARALAELAKDDERVEDCAVVIDTEKSGRAVRLRAQVRLVGEGTVLNLVLPFDTFTPELT